MPMYPLWSSLSVFLLLVHNGLCIVRKPFATGNSTSYVDPINGVRYQRFLNTKYDISFSLAFPPVASHSDEIIGTIVALVMSGYVGLSLGAMTQSLQILMWPNGDNVVFSPRWTDACNPTVYSGPVVHALPDTSVNATHTRLSFHCSNCTSWRGGSLNTNAYTTLAWATSLNLPVTNPADPASTISYHDVTEFFGADLPHAHLTQAEWDKALGKTKTKTGQSMPQIIHAVPEQGWDWPKALMNGSETLD